MRRCLGSWGALSRAREATLKNAKLALLTTTAFQMTLGPGLAGGGTILASQAESSARIGSGAGPIAIAGGGAGGLRLAACSPANPCAAKNPCAARNPCAAKNPCAAANPCDPCAAGEAPELTAAEANAGYDCLLDEMVAGYRASDLPASWHYKDWDAYSSRPYPSETHGSRFVSNYANAVAKPYGRFEEAGRMPVGSILAKDRRV